MMTKRDWEYDRDCDCDVDSIDGDDGDPGHEIVVFAGICGDWPRQGARYFTKAEGLEGVMLPAFARARPSSFRLHGQQLDLPRHVCSACSNSPRSRFWSVDAMSGTDLTRGTLFGGPSVFRIVA